MKYAYIGISLALLLAGCANTPPPSITDTKQNTSKSTTDFPEEIEIKKVSDIEAFLKGKKTGKIEDHAQALAEVDEWLFSPSEEGQAKTILEKEVTELRTRIEVEVANLTKSALVAPTGSVAVGDIVKINSLMMLYPSPVDEASRILLDQLTRNITDTSRRVVDIQRLRYNEWAIKQIKTALDNFHAITKITGVRDIQNAITGENKTKLINNCVTWMSVIDPIFLEPAVLGLHNYAYGKTLDAMRGDEVYMIKLASGFANPANKRKTPSDF